MNRWNGFGWQCATALALVACSSSSGGGSGATGGRGGTGGSGGAGAGGGAGGTTATGGSPSTGGAMSTGGVMSTGGAESFQCIGPCTPGSTCTIDPPAGSDAPSVLCTCTAAGQYCCGGTDCGGGTGGVEPIGCATDCASDGFTCCGGRCVNTGNDIFNCGGCAAACDGPNPYCGFGTCGPAPCDPACTAGQLCCDVSIGPGTRGCFDAQANTCPMGCPNCDCASADTLVATPDGDVPIDTIRRGDVVFSVEGDAIVAAPVLEINRVAVSDHFMVRVRVDSGAIVEMSPRHPTIDGTPFGALRVGDHLGAATVEDIELVPYQHEHTYDLLVATESGAYFAAGTLVGSTLKR